MSKPGGEPAANRPRRAPSLLRRLGRHGNAAAGGLVLLTLAVGLGLVIAFSPYDPIRQNIAARLQGPGAEHLLGTDSLGRDVLTRAAWGGLTSLQIALLAVALGSGLGTAIGLLSGANGAMIDRLVMALVSVVMSFPALLLALFIASLLGNGMVSIILAISATNVALFARLARGETLRVRSEPFVEAARSAGAGGLRVALRHLLPNIWPPLIVALTLRFSTAILTEATVSYLGLGLPPPAPTWGGMVQEGQRALESALWISLAPGGAILLTVLGLNLLGDGLRDALDPRLRGGLQEVGRGTS